MESQTSYTQARLSFSSKCSLFHNSNVFGSCFIHVLYTVCAKIEKNNSGAKRLIFSLRSRTEVGKRYKNRIFYRNLLTFETYSVGNFQVSLLTVAMLSLSRDFVCHNVGIIVLFFL